MQNKKGDNVSSWFGPVFTVLIATSVFVLISYFCLEKKQFMDLFFLVSYLLFQAYCLLQVMADQQPDLMDWLQYY
jgi:hypothetical protein